MTKSCLLYNFKSVKDMFIKFHTSIKHHKTMCRAQQLVNMYFFSYSPLNFVRSSSVRNCKQQFRDKIMSVLDMKTVKDILKLHTNMKYH